MSTYDYDIVLLSDLRYPGGNSSSLAEEIKAQARAGYSTGLVHMRAPHMMRRRSFNSKIMDCLTAGLAELVPPGQEVRTRALVIRQPRLFAEDVPTPLRIRADTTVLVANHPPVDGLSETEPYYDPAAVRDRVADLFGEAPWAPIGPLVRKALTDSGVALNLREEDWVNIVDVDEWRVDRSRFRADRPVIGRHSRGHRSKWPSSRADLLAAYPADDGVAVKVLGGADPAIQALGYRPSNWTVHPFGSMAPRRFLSEIDFFVYYHHPGWVEAFGRNIIEGMASGCPAILPPHFQSVFGDSAIYASPPEVRDRVDALYHDPGEYRSRSEMGTRYVDERFGVGTHVRRVQELIGEPASGSVPARRGSRRVSPRVLLASLEPTGLGSVTRLVRIAREAGERIDPVLIGPWPAVRLGRDAGLLCEVIPDDYLAAGSEEDLLQRVFTLGDQHAADAILVDAHRSLAAGPLAAAAESTPVVLSGPPQAPVSRQSEVLTWGDVAFAEAARSEPSMPLPTETLLTREEARSELGLPLEAPMALLCAGADGRNVASPRLWPVAQAVLDTGWSVAFAEPFAGKGLFLPDAVLRISAQPLHRYLRAFDVAVAVPGYTLTQELVAAGCPSLLMPFGNDAGQDARATAARERGLALAVDEFAQAPLAAALTELRDESVQTRLGDACGAVEFSNGTPRALKALGIAV